MSLEMKPNCEKCGKSLPHDSDDAHICSYECTFCSSCTEEFKYTCPSCNGELKERPRRL